MSEGRRMALWTALAASAALLVAFATGRRVASASACSRIFAAMRSPACSPAPATASSSRARVS
jgi:hypothetical protein